MPCSWLARPEPCEVAAGNVGRFGAFAVLLRWPPGGRLLDILGTAVDTMSQERCPRCFNTHLLQAQELQHQRPDFYELHACSWLERPSEADWEPFRWVVAQQVQAQRQQ